MNTILLIILLTFIGSVVRVISGLGGGTIMVTTLVHILAFEQTLLLAGIVHWFNALLILIFFYHGLNRRLLVFFALPGIVTALMGVVVLSYVESYWLIKSLGVILILYVLFVLFFPKFKLKQTPAVMIVGGCLSGFSKGLFGVGGGVRAAILSTFDLRKAQYLATGAAISLVIDTARLVGYWGYSIHLPSSLYWGMLLFIPTTVVGSLVGRYCVEKVPQSKFRPVVLLFLFVMGIHLLLTPY